MLGRKVLVYILLVSSCLSVFVTAAQLYSDYRYALAELEQELLAIEASHLDSLSLNLWDFQDKAIEQQLTGIQSLPYINLVRLTTPQHEVYQVGDYIAPGQYTENFDIVYKQQVIGVLRVDADHQQIYDKLWQRTWVILASQFIKTLIAALAIVLIIRRVVTRHIYRIEQYASEFSLNKLNTPLTLDGNRQTPDEIDELVVSLNKMREMVKQEFQLRLESEQQLNDFNLHLERKIQQRTQELQSSLQQLKATQNNLVQSEKMVALGQLVAGIAHEINTPLGVSVTASSVMQDDLTRFADKIKSSDGNKQQLDAFITDQLESGKLLQRNLDRAVNLMKNFKAVAVNQSDDTMLECNLEQLIEEVLATVRTMFKAKNYDIGFTIPAGLKLNTYPGAWTQILTNLLINSHIHAFEGCKTGRIQISVAVQDNAVQLIYQDNGAGIPEHLLDKVFDPFVTTKRGSGGSGLGLNILFNLVFNKLEGSVKVENLTQGCRFIIDCPKELS